MKAHDFIGKKVTINLLKFFIVLSVVVVIFTIMNTDFFKFKPKTTITLNPRNMSTKAPKTHGFCAFKPLPPADALEERQLLDLIAWPKTPPVPTPLLLEQTTDPAHSTFTILPGKRGGEWHVGDQLEILIKMYNFQGHAQKTGGDFMVARLYSNSLHAGVMGRVVDHLNGSYSAVFPLLWEGNAQVEVKLHHPSQGVTVLRRLNTEKPDRVVFKSIFRSGSVSETTVCNICLRETSQPQCDFSDLRTGEPWFCYKPKNLSCGARITHMKTGYNYQNLKDEREKLFQRGVNLKVNLKASGPDSVTVLPRREEQPVANEDSGKLGTSGYYYQGLWRPLDGTRVQQFPNSSAISQCLKGKMLHMYGDSTLRQWFEYFTASLPDAKMVDLNGPLRAGPFMIWDSANKFSVTYRVHGLPLRIFSLPISRERYVANELDRLLGGTNTVVILSVWAHFTTAPFELFIRRMQNIRRAVVRLLERAPGTLVVIRTGNVQALRQSGMMNNCDWFVDQINKVFGAMFKGLNVKWVNAWEMVLAHHLPNDLHPPPPIIKSMIDVLLSHICPKSGAS
ncbi:NXPE family member 3-like [Halichoeres trimaculatus]|uniref:NXPE family member 3-like n=1 Tax=Halichoeres trimaculatus TaxID=147232 RepID=UPI003D9DBE05